MVKANQKLGSAEAALLRAALELAEAHHDWNMQVLTCDTPVLQRGGNVSAAIDRTVAARKAYAKARRRYSRLVGTGETTSILPALPNDTVKPDHSKAKHCRECGAPAPKGGFPQRYNGRCECCAEEGWR